MRALPLFTVVPLLACAGPNGARAPVTPGPDETRVSISAAGLQDELRLRHDPTDSSFRLRWNADEVWRVLPGVYEALEVEPDIIDTRTRRLGAGRVTRARLAGEDAMLYLRCAHQAAGPSSVNRMRTQLTVITQVEAVNRNEARLRTAVSGTASNVGGTSASNTNCVSSGRLEQRIAEMVEARLRYQGGR
jgi:hypothetical protein